MADNHGSLSTINEQMTTSIVLVMYTEKSISKYTK